MYYYNQYFQYAVTVELSLSWEAEVEEYASAFISFIFLIYFTTFVEGAAIRMWEELQVSARKQDWKGVGDEKLVIFLLFFFLLNTLKLLA